jgi:hypothetical protein
MVAGATSYLSTGPSSWCILRRTNNILLVLTDSIEEKGTSALCSIWWYPQRLDQPWKVLSYLNSCASLYSKAAMNRQSKLPFDGRLFG